MCRPCSIIRCASAAWASGSTAWITGATVPAASSGHTRASSARAIAPFAATLCGRSVEPVMVRRRRITGMRSISTVDAFRNAICTSRPSSASRSRFRAV